MHSGLLGKKGSLFVGLVKCSYMLVSHISSRFLVAVCYILKAFTHFAYRSSCVWSFTKKPSHL